MTQLQELQRVYPPAAGTWEKDESIWRRPMSFLPTGVWACSKLNWTITSAGAVSQKNITPLS